MRAIFINEEKLPTISLSFQQYEIDNILKALQNEINLEHKNCKWEKQPSGQWYYTPNRKIRQLEFTINSIKRQLNQ